VTSLKEAAPVAILAFGAHPDDVEIGAGGILAKHAKAGRRTVICDLTEAELSSNGTVETRREEARRAGEILGIADRINLGFPDRGLGDRDQIRQMVRVIRRLRPRVVLAPYPKDRHPDHVAAGQMVKEAVFDAGIRKLDVGEDMPAHRVERLYYYFINDMDRPHLLIDISEVYELKEAAILAYRSQFLRKEGEVDTPLNRPQYLAMVRGRAQLWGQQIGADYAEGLASEFPPSVGWLV
jgi:bacillithiol biosynthesis deacetylase BshB1